MSYRYGPDSPPPRYFSQLLVIRSWLEGDVVKCVGRWTSVGVSTEHEWSVPAGERPPRVGELACVDSEATRCVS
jgi:hypothetical protein